MQIKPKCHAAYCMALEPSPKLKEDNLNAELDEDGKPVMGMRPKKEMVCYYGEDAAQAKSGLQAHMEKKGMKEDPKRDPKACPAFQRLLSAKKKYEEAEKAKVEAAKKK